MTQVAIILRCGPVATRRQRCIFLQLQITSGVAHNEQEKCPNSSTLRATLSIQRETSIVSPDLEPCSRLGEGGETIRGD